MRNIAAMVLCVAIASGCGASHAGSVSSDRTLKIVSALPRNGFGRSWSDPVAAAIQTVVRIHGGRAGAYPVEYVDDDDAKASDTPGYETHASCAPFAERLAKQSRVVALVGPLGEDCATTLIPRLDRAGLGVFGFGGTHPSFTHAFPTPVSSDRACWECTPSRYYPAGTRNYLTTMATLDSEGRAAAVLFAERGVHRVAIVREGWDSFLAPWLTAGFRPEARRRGLRIVATLDFATGKSAYTALARRLLAAHPDGVYLMGETPAVNPGQAAPDDEANLLKSIRAAGFRGPIVGSMFQIDARLLVDAGRAAQGALFTSTTLPLVALSPQARRFAAAVGPGTTSQAVYAAAATQVALRAIAASDGSRAGVRTQMFRVKMNSLVGPISFDANGDVHPQRIAVYRIAGRRFAYAQTVSFP